MAFIGWITSKALGWAMPGLSAGSLYLLAGALAFTLVGSVAFLKGAEGKTAAVATERAACDIDKANNEAAASRALAALMEEISKLSDESDDKKTGAELCKGSPFCRDGGKK